MAYVVRTYNVTIVNKGSSLMIVNQGSPLTIVNEGSLLTIVNQTTNFIKTSVLKNELLKKTTIVSFSIFRRRFHN